MDVDSRNTSASPWHRSLIRTESPLAGEEKCVERGRRSSTSEEPAARDAYLPPPTPPHHQNIPEQLAELLITMIGERKVGELSGEDLAEAFRDGPDVPPVTTQSLSELDIQSIITNIKLRHDVNFDRDLSFRPNVDGVKGIEKKRAQDKYKNALIAELTLYGLLSQEAPPLRGIEHMKPEDITYHAERRLPTLFHTIREVLKSLVPDRDHTRVEEHLDVSMLMQEIERGVCDMVRLAEWIAHLLKEHCAPMRDDLVDNMVTSTKAGVSQNDVTLIVRGLSELLGILEAMKLDVANHQIRNLKTILIEDTLNFEKHYHLDRLVHGRSRVNVNTTQSWYADANDEFGSQCTPRSRDVSGFQLEVFTRAVVAILFGRDGRSNFPDTFYLDHDRLRLLQAEIDDLVFVEICMEMFAVLAKELGSSGTITLAIGQELRTSISAIMGEASDLRPQQWMMNSEALSLEILRQASRLAGRSPTYHFDRLADANQHLRRLFVNNFAQHAAQLEAALLPQILGSADRHGSSSPMELFNSLVSVSSSTPLPPYPAQPLLSDTCAFAPLHQEIAKLTDIANRITHIVLLHWRVWGHIAYLQDDDSQQSSIVPSDDEMSRSSISPHPTLSHCSQPHVSDEAAQVVATMKTGEPLDSSQEAHVAHQTPSQ
ncbi:Protein SOSEKI 1 [Neocucurbitaria cava]|uniref:Protein SOSEKI 1 n=1 Tax=Neocucurbitaria cava TaxID=798079 RepID=A0A9W9CJ46_9PLEO|nr:Protein SOSEKI 1 [Neocucurbitaria cava]